MAGLGSRTLRNTAVVLTARIASYAGPGQVLVTEEVTHHAVGHVQFEEVGEVLLKGMSKAFRLHRAVHVG